MKSKKTKRDLEIENAHLRGRVEALEKIVEARRPAPLAVRLTWNDEGPFVLDPPLHVHSFAGESSPEPH